MKNEIHSENDIVINEIINGLSSKQKKLPSKLFYDERGSELFDLICELEEYYPTRTEKKILEDNLEEIISVFQENTLFIEFGSGSSQKTKLLLERIPFLSGYIPIDISEKHLNKSVESLKEAFPELEIFPMAADYTQPLQFPELHHIVEHKITFFPGSTIGNFLPDDARKFLNLIASECGEGGGLLIGVDLKKDKEILEAAYNDNRGVTAEFNLNMLRHINREFGFDFDLSKFCHRAIYNDEMGRIEMHIVSLENQIVNGFGKLFRIIENEYILTEYSHKYSIQNFEELASDSFNVKKVWTDPDSLFSLQFFEVKSQVQ